MSHVYQSHLTVVIGNPNKEMQSLISQQAKEEGGMEKIFEKEHQLVEALKEID